MMVMKTYISFWTSTEADIIKGVKDRDGAERVMSGITSFFVGAAPVVLFFVLL